MAEVRKQVNKSEQITLEGSIVEDYDQPLQKREEILNAYKKFLGINCSVEKYGNNFVYTYTHDGIKEYFLTSSITYLSKPHPIFKKRTQLKSWYKDFYNEYKVKSNTRVRLIGVYHYENLIVFAEFKAEDYLGRKCNNSAAHIFSNDIYQAVVDGLFERVDKNNNHLTVICGDNFKNYLGGHVKGNCLLEFFKKFNKIFPFGKWITAETAISEMKNANWSKWKETEWPGWYLEFLFNEFITGEKISWINYRGTQPSSCDFDFDVHFLSPTDFYGDLKASDIDKKEAPGNDQKNVLSAISAHGKLWYIIYEHETIKDTSRNSEMAIKRMELMDSPYVEGGHISYQTRMKHSVRFKKMIILELNKINMNEVLKEFRQGHQPSGDARKPKFLISKQNIENCTVLTYSCDEEGNV